jgi:hypothetical protein
VNKRKHPKVWGAGESGVARGPETEVVQGCQMVGESSQLLSVLCVWREGGEVWVCQCVGCEWEFGESWFVNGESH